MLVQVKYEDGHTSNFDLLILSKDLNDTQLQLNYAKSDKTWSEQYRGKQAASIYCDGEAYHVEIDGDKFKLDFSQAEIMMILLKSINRVYNSYGEIEYYKKVGKFGKSSKKKG